MAIFKSYVKLPEGTWHLSALVYPKENISQPQLHPNSWAIGWIFYGPNVRVVAPLLFRAIPLFWTVLGPFL